VDAVRIQGKGQVTTVIYEKEHLQLSRSVPERQGLAIGSFIEAVLLRYWKIETPAMAAPFNTSMSGRGGRVDESRMT
jgi:hypothetical protein